MSILDKGAYMKKLLVVHPFLFAIFPILFLFSYNRPELTSFSEILLPSAIVLGATLLLLLLCFLFLRNSQKAGIIVSVFLILFFSYGHAYEAIENWQIGSFVIGEHKYLLFVWGLLFACSFYFIVRIRKDLYNLTNILNVMATSLVVITLVNIGLYEYKTRDIGANIFKRSRERGSLIRDSGKEATPRDIYYIVLDGYASSSTLRDIYGYDNSEFTDYLTKNGFYIASQSQSNYTLTHLSLASSLNMEYVNYLSDKLGIESKSCRVPYQMIENSKVMNLLKDGGYKFIHFSSGWRATDSNQYADLDVQWGGSLASQDNEFLLLLIQTSVLNCFQQDLVKWRGKQRILGTFSKLAEVPEIEGPKFVFAHIIPPHPPYFFGANGEYVRRATLKMHGPVWGQKENYLNQLMFVNKKIKTLVDELLSKSKVPPIIILQADHGSASTFYGQDSSGWQRPTQEMLRERMTIFNAYYLPDENNDLLYDSITPVNTFRLIFNSYLDTNYELLDDKSYYSTYQRPYEFRNVSDKMFD